MRIAVLTGGASAERDVALASGRAVAQALRARGHQVLVLDAVGGRLLEAPELQARIGRAPPRVSDSHEQAGPLARTFERVPEAKDTEVVFVALHGGAGEDGRIQAVLDLIGVPYTGSGPLGSALAMDKLVSKELFCAARIPTPAWLVGEVGSEEVDRQLGGYPVIVKPSHEGSTVGVTVVRSAAELRPAIERAGAFTGPPLVERFIPGRELAVGVLGGDALPIVEIRPQHEIYDYECKYTPGMSEYEVPARLDPAVATEVQELAARAHRVLRLSAYSRIDFRLDDEGRPWCLEANSLPGLTATSLLPKAAAAAGISFEELCDRIVRLAATAEAGAGTPPDDRG